MRKPIKKPKKGTVIKFIVFLVIIPVIYFGTTKWINLSSNLETATQKLEKINTGAFFVTLVLLIILVTYNFIR